MKNDQHLFRYEETANKVETIIKNLNLKAGDKIPSLRQVGKELNVSQTTVFQAFNILEARGLIISRTRSGYFVNASAKNNIISKSGDKYIPLANQVTLNTMIDNMLRNVREHGVMNFSILAPANELLPISRISKAIRDSLKDTKEGVFQYPLIEGHPRLVKQIVRRTFDWETSLSTGNILITNGCTEAINICLDAVAKPGDIILIESPAPYGLLQSLETKNMFALEVTAHPNTGLDLDQLQIAINQHKVTACILTTICNAPLGCSMSKEKMLQVLKILDEHNIPLIEDDALGALSFNTPKPLPAKAYDKNNNVLYCTSFSKSLGSGLRIGWVSGGRYHEKIKRLKYISNFFTNGILQDAIGRFLESGLYDVHLKKMKAALQQNLARYLVSINQYFPENVKVSTPQGGMCIWMELPIYINASELYQRALKEGIGLSPGQIFTATNQYDNYIRINYCLIWNTRVDKHLEKLAHLIINYQKYKSIAKPGI